MWKMINKESNLTTALLVLCQDYIIIDEEFASNQKIKKRWNDAEFWIELAQLLRGSLVIYLQEKVGVDNEGYDEYEAVGVSDIMILNFVMNPFNRFELNDIICETVESWINHSGRKK